MPALSDTMLAVGFRALRAIHGQSIVVLTGAEAGETFTGILLVAQSLDLDADLGPDPREKTVVHFATTGAPALASQDKLSIDGQTWLVVKRTSNPADLTIDYELTKVVSGKDA